MAPQLSLSMREDAARRLAASHIALIDRAIAIGDDILDWSRQQAVAAFMALGAGQSTAYKTLGELQEYGYVRLLGGLIKILGSPRPRRPRRTAAGERSATFAEALPFVRGAMRWLVREKNRVARWRIRQVANQDLARSQELPGVKITMYQLGRCLAELQCLGEFTQVNPAVPVKTTGWDGSERWESEPAEWAPGRCKAAPVQRRRRRTQRNKDEDQWRRLTSCRHWPREMMIRSGDARDTAPDPGAIVTDPELAGALRRMNERASSFDVLAEEEFEPA